VSGPGSGGYGRCEYTLKHGTQGDIFFVGKDRLFAVGDGSKKVTSRVGAAAAAPGGGGMLSYWDLPALDKHQPLTLQAGPYTNSLLSST